MKLPVHNAEGKAVGEVELDARIFGVEAKPALIQQAVVAQQAGRRLGLAQTKDRSEVSGGGKKPWRQKGTGRARHGSTRSPIWIGGGVTFGPANTRNYTQKMNAKARQKALFACLSDKAASGQIIVLDALAMEAPKTKTLTETLERLGAKLPVLLVLPKSSQALFRSARNVVQCETILADSLNVVSVLTAKTLVILQESFAVMQKTYRKV
jgi:large subunit ribosomal protein L4